MKKIFELKNLDCAHCVSKMEVNINKIKGIHTASINFFTGKLLIEADENSFDEIMQKVVKICKKIEPGCKIEL